MTKHNTLVLAGLFVALALSGCDNEGRIDRRLERQAEREANRGENRQTTEARKVDAFDSIDMEGAAHLYVTIGQRESLTIEGGAGAVKRLTTRVAGDTLYIRTKGLKHWMRDKHQGGLTVRVTVPRLASLNVEGGNDVQLSGFDGGKTRIKTEGATHVRGSGHLDELTVRMEGAGHADLRNLIANEAKVTVAGVGSVYVHPRDSLDATMNGIGAILYSGSPRDVNTRMNGLGTISKHDLREARRWEGRHWGGRWSRRDDDDRKDERRDDQEEKAAKPPVDPDTLQPEREDKKEPRVERETV